MKTRKLLAILVAVAMIVTMLPVVASAATPSRFASVFEVDKTSVEADGSKMVKFTVYTLDSGNNPVGATVYFASSREDADNFFDENGTGLTPESVSVDGTEYNVYSVTTSASDGKGVFKVNSAVAGKATIGIGLNPEVAGYLVGEDVSASAAGLIGTQVIEFTASKVGTVTVVKVAPKGETAITESATLNAAEESDGAINVNQVANGLDYYEVTFRVTTSGGARVSGEEVEFSLNKTGATLNKTSATTSTIGEAKVRVFATKPGTYQLEGKVGSESDVVYLKFGAGTLFDLSLEDGDGDLVAKDTSHEIEVKLLDVNGNKVDAAGYVSEGVLDSEIEVEVVDEPDDSDIEDELTFSVNADDHLVVTTPDLSEEGEYTIRVALANGKYVEATFEVKEQGDITALELEYPQAAVKLGGSVGAPKVKRVDANGVKVTLDTSTVESDIRFIASDVRKLDGPINADGSFTATADKDYAGVLTITAIDTVEKVSATFEITIGTEPTAISLTLDGKAITGETAKVWLELLDANGDLIAFGSGVTTVDVDSYVLSKPSGALVTVDASSDAQEELQEDGKTYLEVTTNKDGAVKVQVVVTADEGLDTEQRFTASITLNFGEEVVVDKGASKVVLTIGGTFGFVDGAVTSLDAPAFIEGGRTFVPVRFLAEAFGAEADWEPKDAPVETVTLTREDMEIIINIGEEVLTVVKDGEEEVVTFDGAARIVDGRTYLPFRAIAEAFGAEVDYGPQDGPVEWVSFEQ